jgi:NAD-dependent deacetylase
VPGAEPFAAFPPRSPFAEHALLRPDVVWFGEALPSSALEATEEALDRCDLFMSVGTSSVVYPAAGFAQLALGRDASVIEVNAEPTPLTGLATWSIRGKAGAILPTLVGEAFAP